MWGGLSLMFWYMNDLIHKIGVRQAHQGVPTCLQHGGLDIADNPTSKRDMQKIQATFNHWHEESTIGFSHMSRICALSL